MISNYHTIRKHLFQASHLVAYDFEKMPPGFFFSFHQIHTIYIFFMGTLIYGKKFY